MRIKNQKIAHTGFQDYPLCHANCDQVGGGTRGFLAMPRRLPPPYGAVVLGHERYGLVQHTLDLAAKFVLSTGVPGKSVLDLM